VLLRPPCEAATAIQTAFRKHAAPTAFRSVRGAAVKIQALARGAAARRAKAKLTAVAVQAVPCAARLRAVY
jgi:hypothetical protein